MTLAALSLSLLVLAAPGAPGGKASKLEQGQARFAQGDFDGALKALDAAAQESQDPAALEKVHLLRGLCFAARQDFSRAEDAFEHALEAAPGASLDPGRVDPSVVKLLDAVRGRLTGVLLLVSSPPGAGVSVNGKAAGVTPLTLPSPIGRHVVEVTLGDERHPVELLVYPRRETRAHWVLAAKPAPGPAPAPRAMTLYGDFRGTVEVAADERLPLQSGLDLGGGIELGPLRAGLLARLFPFFGVAPRVGFAVPVVDRLTVFLEAQVPLWFRNGGIGVGLGGGAGAEFAVASFFGVYGQVGGQHLFSNPGRIDDTHLLASVGVRIRPP